MEVKITFEIKEAVYDLLPAFIIQKHVGGGPARGTADLAWTRDRAHAELIVEALRKMLPKSWTCPRCHESHARTPKQCQYCGTKPETS